MRSFTDLVAFPVMKADPRRGLDPLVLEHVSLCVLLTLSDTSHTTHRYATQNASVSTILTPRHSTEPNRHAIQSPRTESPTNYPHPPGQFPLSFTWCRSFPLLPPPPPPPSADLQYKAIYR